MKARLGIVPKPSNSASTVEALLFGDQLNAVPEGIKDVTASDTRNRAVVVRFNPCLPQTGDQLRVVAAAQRGMRLAGRPEFRFHPQVQSHVAAGKPGAAALGQPGRLSHFGHSQ